MGWPEDNNNSYDPMAAFNMPKQFNSYSQPQSYIPDTAYSSRVTNPTAYSDGGFTNFGAAAPTDQSLWGSMGTAVQGNGGSMDWGSTAPGDWMSIAGNKMKDWGLVGTTDPITKIKTEGSGGLILGAASGIMNGYLGMKNLGIAQDTLAFNKESFNRNFDAQMGMTRGNITAKNDQRNRESASMGVLGKPQRSTQDALAGYGIMS